MTEIWLDTSALIDIEKGALLKAVSLEDEIIRLQRIGYKVMITPAVEKEFLSLGKAPDAVKKRMILRKLSIQVDTMVHQVPETQIAEWEAQNKKHQMSAKDARVAAEVKAAGHVRGIKKPTFLTREIGNKLIIWRQKGLDALFFTENALEKARPPVRPKPPAPPPPTPPTPKPPSGFKANIKAGFAGAFSLSNIASMIPQTILAIADRAAVKDALRNIQIKFVKEGFAKGVAAGVMGWTEEEVRLNLKNRVTSFRVRGLGDAAGHLKGSDIFKLAESVENFAVDVGYAHAYPMGQDWRKEMLGKGFEALKAYGYYFGEDPAVLFEFEFIDKLAWVLKKTTDAIIEPHIKFK